MLRYATLPCALLALTSLSAAAQTTAPGAAWPTAEPAAVGLNRAVLDSLDQEIQSGKYGYVDHVLIIRHGKVAWDKRYAHDYVAAYADSLHVKGPLNASDFSGPYNYYNPWWHPYYRGETLHTLQSVSKTVTSVIFGVAVTRGDIASVDRPVLSFFDTTAVSNIDDRKRHLTIRHLLTMTGGFDWNEAVSYMDPRNSATQLEASPDWVKFVINRPMAAEPGAVWAYNSGGSVLLADVFRKATGTDIEEYAAKYLFAPLGIHHWYWKRSPTGLIDTEGGLYLEPADLARIWYLFLHNGEWNGQRIVSADWVKTSVSPLVRTNAAATGPRYGLSWWLYPENGDTTHFYWSGNGFGGQFPVVFPEQDMVVVVNSWNILRGKSLPMRPTLDRLSKAVVGK